MSKYINNNILVQTITFNDNYIAHYFCNHYIKYLSINPNNIIIYNNFCNDNTINILLKHGIPKENIILIGDEIEFSDRLNAEIKNYYWKDECIKRNNKIDWVINIDFDELLYIPGGAIKLKQHLDYHYDNNIPFPKVAGINIISPTYITDNKDYKQSNNILDLYNQGVWDSLFSKQVIHRTNIETAGYNYGAHKISPIPNKYKTGSSHMFLLHIKKIKEIEQYKFECYKNKTLNDGANNWYTYHKKISIADDAYNINNYRYNIKNIKDKLDRIYNKKTWYEIPAPAFCRNVKYVGKYNTDMDTQLVKTVVINNLNIKNNNIIDEGVELGEDGSLQG